MKDITLDDVKNKTPALEELLLEIVKKAGAKRAVLFDGSIINLVKSSENEDK